MAFLLEKRVANQLAIKNMPVRSDNSKTCNPFFATKANEINQEHVTSPESNNYEGAIWEMT
jgi:hypothetical protein